MAESQMELLVWGSNWGVPSVDARSLQMMTYTRLCGAPVIIKATNSPFQSPSGTLPVFHHGSVVITDYITLVHYLTEKNYNADANLTSEQQSEITAYIQLMEQKLWPAIMYSWWSDEKNYIEVTRPWMAGVLSFPLNYYYPGHYKRKTEATIQALYGVDEINTIENSLFKESKRCLNLLVSKLDSHHFFHGTSPTSLDAYVLGALAPIIAIPFPSAVLANHIKGCPTLLDFVQKLTRRCFPAVTGASTPKLKKETKDDSDFPHKRRNQFFAFITAMGATLLYALYSGILQLEYVPTGNPETEEFFDDEEPHS